MNRTRRSAFIAMAAAAIGGRVVPAHAAPASPGETVRWPGVTLLDGTRWNAERVAGKAVIVEFWSTTCPFCMRQTAPLPNLRAASGGLPLKTLPAVRERDPEEVRRYMPRHGHRFAVTQDWLPLAEALSTRRVIPLTVTVDRRGRLAQVIPGEMFEEDVLELRQLAA
jgi:hypothetical protein